MLLNSLSVPAAAADDIVFGPKTFALAAGKPQVFTETISLEMSGCSAAIYTLRISNGASSGHGNNLVSSGRVVLDGTELLSDRDFQRQQRFWSFTLTSGGDHILQIHLKGGKLGAYLTIAVERSQANTCGPSVAIDSPAAGAVVETNRIVVTGTVARSNDVGVSVNGIAADLQLFGPSDAPLRWSALVNGPPGPLELYVVATDSAGARELRRTIMYVPLAEDVTFSANVASGVAPLSVSFFVSGTGRVARYELDLDGDGEFLETNAGGRPFTNTYAAPGFYMARLRAVLESGAVVTGELPVTVHSFSAMNQLIRSRWDAFAAALAASDIDVALSNITPAARNKYEKALRLIAPTLPRFAAGLRNIYPMAIRYDTAAYLLTRPENGQIRGYHLYFTRDTDGRWKVTQF